ncbi:uncharacterized protein METZ01_LOCUS234276, partial [marine metagenome]
VLSINNIERELVSIVSLPAIKELIA